MRESLSIYLCEYRFRPNGSNLLSRMPIVCLWRRMPIESGCEDRINASEVALKILAYFCISISYMHILAQLHPMELFFR